jgi:uncharacterized protein (TIGR02246 family)
MNHDDDIARVLRAFEAAWAARDGEAVAQLFAEEAVFTTPTFERSIGRAAIARSEQQAYDTYFRGTRVELHVEHATPLRDDVALLHTANRIFRDEQLVVESHAMVVLDAASGDWQIAGWHNLVPLQMPPR